MATKKSSTKKGKPKPKDIDPPIVVTGGGDESISKPGKNAVWITYVDEMGRIKRVRVRSDAAPSLTELSVKVSGQNGSDPPTAPPPIMLAGYEFYKVEIAFGSGAVLKGRAAKTSKSKKGKAAGKRPSARK